MKPTQTEELYLLFLVFFATGCDAAVQSFPKGVIDKASSDSSKSQI